LPETAPAGPPEASEASLAAVQPDEGEATTPNIGEASDISPQASPVESPQPRGRPAPVRDEISAVPVGASYRQLWLFAAGAFVVGAVGFLAFFGKGTDPAPSNATPADLDPSPGQAAQSSPPEAKAEPQPAVLEPKAAPPEAKAVLRPAAPVIKAAPRAAVPSPTGPNPVVAAKAPSAQNPAVASATPAPADLHRKCLEVDADGKGKTKAVAGACRPALKADPKDVEVMVILARTELDLGRLVEARALAKKALAADPNRFDAYIYLGNAEQEAGRIDEARTAYKKYLELAPNGPFARELRAILNNL
jgi:hypothetical protein